LIEEDLSFHNIAPYIANPNTPIHRWLLIPESCSLEWAKLLIEEAGDGIEYVIDPFCGSGTVALQCDLNGINYIGGDYLADMTIATLAKIHWHEISQQDFVSQTKKLSELIDKIQMTDPNNIGKLHQHEMKSYLVGQIHKYVLESQQSLPCKYTLLTAIYSAIRSTNENDDVANWYGNLRRILGEISEDLGNSLRRPARSKRVIYYGDSRFANWPSLMSNMQILRDKGKGLLLTSPTYVSSSQRRDKLTEDCNLLASTALERMPEIPKYPSRNNSRYSTIDGIVNKAPKEAHNFLKTVAQILHNFRELSIVSSQVIIENENPQVEQMVIENDLYICSIASQLGFVPTKIRVTHYVETPGFITYTTNLKRGSLIYLKSI
jgi:hypothetical protein